MKKILLFLCGLSLVLSTKDVTAQSFTMQSGNADTAKAYYNGTDDLNVYNYIKSTSANNIYIKWHVTSQSLAPGWTITGFCDNYICDPTPGINVPHISDGYGPTFEDFHAQFGGLSAAQNNTFSYMKVTAKDTISGTTRNLTFIGYKNPQGIGSTVTSFDDITIFPNPAREAVNVIFDEKAGVKTIAIYNLIGKVMNVYRPTDNGSAKLDIDNIPAGVYFMRLMDGKGHILATRRFTRQ
jgi:hypothetical protein